VDNLKGVIMNYQDRMYNMAVPSLEIRNQVLKSTYLLLALSMIPTAIGALFGINMSFMFSIIIFFSVLAIGLNTALPAALYKGLVNQNVPVTLATQISQLPPTSALFAALLGYNPMKTLIPSNVLSSIPNANSSVITGNEFFPNLISEPFSNGLKIVLVVGTVMAIIAALASSIKEKKVENKN
jgi:hypothetical protein